MSIYLDCNATTPLDPRVASVVRQFLEEEFGNAGSRTHEYGARAKSAVQQARDQVAAIVHAQRDEVVFTSGATEANNLAIFGLAPHGEKTGRRHIISTAIEHKAVIEPLMMLRDRGFDVTFIPTRSEGVIDTAVIIAALRPDTLLVSVMHVNNETGVIQPLPALCRLLADHPAYLHVDAAQGFGKDLAPLQDPRVDLISVSGHKVYGPKGVGALIARRRGSDRVPLTPLFYGGGQERGLRPGTLPVPLIVGLGLAAELAYKDGAQRAATCARFRRELLSAFRTLGIECNGDQERVLPHVINFSIPGVDAEAFMIATKHLIAVSNGSACTSHSYQPSHVLEAMGLPDERVRGAIRMSWCHLTPAVDWTTVISAVQHMR